MWFYAIQYLHKHNPSPPTSSQLNHRIFGWTENMRKPKNVQESVTLSDTWFFSCYEQQENKQVEEEWEACYEIGDPWNWGCLRPQYIKEKEKWKCRNIEESQSWQVSFWPSFKAPVRLLMARRKEKFFVEAMTTSRPIIYCLHLNWRLYFKMKKIFKDPAIFWESKSKRRTLTQSVTNWCIHSFIPNWILLFSLHLVRVFITWAEEPLKQLSLSPSAPSQWLCQVTAEFRKLMDFGVSGQPRAVSEPWAL